MKMQKRATDSRRLKCENESHLSLSRLDELLEDYPHQELVTLTQNCVFLKSKGAGQYLVLDAHLTSLMSFETS
jgi:hypothetical protein